MPTARTIYILTQDGQIQAATYDRQRADQWVGLGDMYDYVPLTPEAYTVDPTAPESAREQPAASMRRIQDTLKQQEKIQERVERLRRRFEPKSSLLRSPD